MSVLTQQYVLCNGQFDCSEFALVVGADLLGLAKLHFFLFWLFGEKRYEKFILWLLHKYETQTLHVCFGTATLLCATDSVMFVPSLQRQMQQMCKHQEDHDVLKSHVALFELRVLLE